jgi:hypothetical protein
MWAVLAVGFIPLATGTCVVAMFVGVIMVGPGSGAVIILAKITQYIIWRTSDCERGYLK